jgi:ABC-type transport system substrate-binding protein
MAYRIRHAPAASGTGFWSDGRLAGRRSRAGPDHPSAANLAMVGEPPSLDPMQATTDLVGTIMQHVYEPLYTFDAKWNVVPMLAEGMPRFRPTARSSPSRCARA